MDYHIAAISKEHITSYWSALDAVAREHQYLAFLHAPPIESTKAFIEENLKGNWPHLVALHENKVIGWCDISGLDRPVFAHIGSLGIGVLAQYRGQGVGKALMTQALDLAKARGLTRIELTVREHNKVAIKLYEQLGFVVEGTHINGVCINGVYENHLFMARLF